MFAVTSRPLTVAQHEAAHVVVGVALGLRLDEADLVYVPGDRAGQVVFFEGPRFAIAVMYAAGVAWDARSGAPSYRSRWDAKQARSVVRGMGRGAYDSAVRAAAAMLAGLGPAHARVTRALCERDLTGKDITALARGERLDSE